MYRRTTVEQSDCQTEACTPSKSVEPCSHRIVVCVALQAHEPNQTRIETKRNEKKIKSEIYVDLNEDTHFLNIEAIRIFIIIITSSMPYNCTWHIKCVFCCAAPYYLPSNTVPSAHHLPLRTETGTDDTHNNNQPKSMCGFWCTY